ncbi:MAG: hypothetical protein US89_C0005G0070 [Candidatus Peregrinibacteria bacterium GW2011_GWF2_38_29]|nr:MAG: hypothetical protein US89_C0005G0070 [Candidatus Peregrinibacteria bacterium GW2011_GWF2_38_29]HBB02657.1 hypothetical protein [Candidatus Peregrinibacteria bacterium]
MNKQFFSTSEIAEMLNVSRITVFNRIKNGQIKAEKIGRNYVVPAESVTPFLQDYVSESDKKNIKKLVDRAFAEYGETIKRLGDA